MHYAKSALVALVLIFAGCLAEQKSANQVGQNTHPVWSPDGDKIAFISNREGVNNNNPVNFEIYVMDANGSNEVRLTKNTAFEADISWSPDGSKIAFKSYRDKNDEIYVMNADGSQQRNLTNHPAAEHSPSWSPDGSRIVFNSNRDGKNEIYVMDSDGGNVMRLTTHDSSNGSPSWSPDGRQIAFVSNRDGNDEIYLMNADGSNQRRLTNAPKSDWYPVWSPDGARIAITYGDWESDKWSVYVINTDDSNRRLLFEGSDSGNVTWSRDGKKIAFGSERDGRGEIYVMNADGSQVFKLTSQGS